MIAPHIARIFVRASLVRACICSPLVATQDLFIYSFCRLNKKLMEALRVRGISNLYSHQHEGEYEYMNTYLRVRSYRRRV